LPSPYWATRLQGLRSGRGLKAGVQEERERGDRGRPCAARLQLASFPAATMSAAWARPWPSPSGVQAFAPGRGSLAQGLVLLRAPPALQHGLRLPSTGRHGSRLRDWRRWQAVRLPEVGASARLRRRPKAYACGTGVSLGLPGTLWCGPARSAAHAGRATLRARSIAVAPCHRGRPSPMTTPASKLTARRVLARPSHLGPATAEAGTGVRGRLLPPNTGAFRAFESGLYCLELPVSLLQASHAPSTTQRRGKTAERWGTRAREAKI
jgi:hypothetical protein